MNVPTLFDLQESVKDKSAFQQLDNYYAIGIALLSVIQNIQPTRIVSPNDHHYIFFQYDKDYGHKITRPLNSQLFIEAQDGFKNAIERFTAFLVDLKQTQDSIVNRPSVQTYLATNEINKVIYTIQQSIGSSTLSIFKNG